MSTLQALKKLALLVNWVNSMASACPPKTSSIPPLVFALTLSVVSVTLTSGYLIDFSASGEKSFPVTGPAGCGKPWLLARLEKRLQRPLADEQYFSLHHMLLNTALEFSKFPKAQYPVFSSAEEATCGNPFFFLFLVASQILRHAHHLRISTNIPLRTILEHRYVRSHHFKHYSA